MENQGNKTINEQVSSYNNDCERAIAHSVTYGSLQRPRATLAQLAGLVAANDNQKREG
jgi:hypothetical protein